MLFSLNNVAYFCSICQYHWGGGLWCSRSCFLYEPWFSSRTWFDGKRVQQENGKNKGKKERKKEKARAKESTTKMVKTKEIDKCYSIVTCKQKQRVN